MTNTFFNTVIELYNSGMSCRQIGIKFNKSRNPILKILRDNNIVLRTKQHEYSLHPMEPSTGILNTNWKGGVTSLREKIRKSAKYVNWRTQVFGRDNFTCQHCGVRGTWLEAHHKKHFADIIEENNITTLIAAYKYDELWDIANGITLCNECHNKTKGI